MSRLRNHISKERLEGIKQAKQRFMSDPSDRNGDYFYWYPIESKHYDRQEENTLSGTSENNFIHGFDGSNTLSGLGGNDYLTATIQASFGLKKDGTPKKAVDLQTNNTFDGGEDSDTASFGGFSQRLKIDLRAEDKDGYVSVYRNGEERDKLKSIENIIGSEKRDCIRGNDKSNILHGDDGDDSLWGYGGQDYLSGGKGEDTLRGGSGNDFLFGNQGQDHLYGGRDDDFLHGGRGEDFLHGGHGADIMQGGKDADTFLYTRLTDSTDEQQDIIVDFNRNEGDVIDFSRLDTGLNSITPVESGRVHSSGLSFSGTSAAENSVWYTKMEDGDGVIVHVNMEESDMSIKILGVSEVTYNDFVL